MDVASARTSGTEVVTKMKEGLAEDEELAEGSEEDKSSISSITRTSVTTSLSRLSPFRMISPKGVTLPMLIQDGIIDPGEKMLSMEYMGQKFVGDLLPSGKIRWPESPEIFNSPSAWAIHCKQLVNPAKKTGCGWSSIKYKGKKLDAYKSAWFAKHRASFSHPPFFTSSPLHSSADDLSRDSSLLLPEDQRPKEPVIENTHPAHSSTPVTNGVNKKRKLDSAWKVEDIGQEEALDLCIRPSRSDKPAVSPEKTAEKSDLVKNGDRQVQKTDKELLKMPPQRDSGVPKADLVESLKTSSSRKVVKYSSLGKRTAEQDRNILVECISFNSIGKVQPFRAAISSNCILLIDFHCHLSSNEVVGYLGGRWDPASHILHIQQAFPCRCHLGDKDNAPAVEEEIRQSMEKRGLWLIGWYHSHPKSSPQPSLRDIDSQVEYQFKMKGPGNSFSPCLGLIVSSYQKGNTSTESTFQGFWVLPPVEQRVSDYGIPMQINYSVTQDNYLTQDVYSEMKRLVDFYSSRKEFIDFMDQWEPSWTYLDKLKCSLSNKFPKDQTDGKILEFLDSLLVGSHK